jgi:hypothetical protein
MKLQISRNLFSLLSLAFVLSAVSWQKVLILNPHRVDRRGLPMYDADAAVIGIW